MINRKGMLGRIYIFMFFLISVGYITISIFSNISNKVNPSIMFGLYLVIVVVFPALCESVLFFVFRKKLSPRVENKEYTLISLDGIPFFEMEMQDKTKRLYFTKEGKLLVTDYDEMKFIQKPEGTPDKMLVETEIISAGGLLSGYNGGNHSTFTMICDIPEEKQLVFEEDEVDEVFGDIEGVNPENVNYAYEFGGSAEEESQSYMGDSSANDNNEQYGAWGETTDTSASETDDDIFAF